MSEIGRVVIVGGGFGGLEAARALKRAPVAVTLIDCRNYHLFQPLLYQVATGSLSPANISSPLRALVRWQPNVEVALAEVLDIDIEARRVVTDTGTFGYDRLILAAGSTHSYFGNPQWERLAPGLKSIDDATNIRRQVLLAFEAAELAADPAEVEELLTFVIIGGGPTGVELAGTLAEMARHTLANDFRHIRPRDAKILLVEGCDRVLPSFAPSLSARAGHDLRRLGVTVMTAAMVTEVDPAGVLLRRGADVEHIGSRTVLWAAGVQASPLTRVVADQTGAQLDRAGRLLVDPDLSLSGHPEISVIGDMAHFAHQTGDPLPALAPVAMQQGCYVARQILGQFRDQPLAQFRYRDYGTMATIGRFKAVADLRGFRFAGPFAWLAWLLVHLMAIVQFQNRLLVLVQWAWNYATWNRAARLITGEAARPAAMLRRPAKATSAPDNSESPPNRVRARARLR
jgi:NADH dehydrogenase